jgi:hypothetical protein
MLSVPAVASESVDIKGLHAGMQGYELRGHLKDFCYIDVCLLSHKPMFTVGGVRGHLLAARYDGNGAADLIDFEFDSFGFAQLRTAMVEKFPATRCIESEVITRLGLQVPQVVCRYETDKDGIYLVRVAGNINKSIMFVLSAEKRDELREHIAAATRDM